MQKCPLKKYGDDQNSCVSGSLVQNFSSLEYQLPCESKQGAAGNSSNHEDPPAYDAVEDLHFNGVCEALSNYALDSLNELARMEYHFHGLSKDDQELLIEKIDSRIENIKHCILVNQRFLDLLLLEKSPRESFQDSHQDLTDFSVLRDQQHERKTTHVNEECSSRCVDSYRGHPANTLCSHERALASSHQMLTTSSPRNKENGQSPNNKANKSCDASQCYHVDIPESIRQNNISKVRSTLRQFVRDWSEEGKLERDAAYNPLLEDLETLLPLKLFVEKHKRLPRILCPGSGLGRLPFEVARRGYGCQGNEFSFFMLLGSNLILNSKIPVKSLVLHPYCLSTSNRVGHRDHLVEVRIPDVCPVDSIKVGHDFSMCAGEFVEVYWDQEKQWDAILTCFFIDTAKNILQYIRTIARILPEGGIWANLGPLLYHFSDVTNEISIELSYQEIRQVILRYFIILKESWHYAFYTLNPASMMHIRYNCIHFAAVRNDTPVAGVSNPVY